MVIIWFLAVAVSQALSALPTHVFVRPPTSVSDCYGGNNGLTNTDVVLTYGYERDWPFNTTTLTISSEVKTRVSYNLSYPDSNEENFANRNGLYLFEQQEHGGGACNCVFINFLQNSNSESE